LRVAIEEQHGDLKVMKKDIATIKEKTPI